MELKYLLKNGEEPTVELPSQAFLAEEAYQQYLHDYNTEINHAKREGEARGEARGKAKSILLTLTKRFKAVPQPLEEIILGIADLERLEKLADHAFDCESIEEFGKALK